MKKHVFVLWSGGLDSTYLVHKLLKEGHKVTTGYIRLGNNVEQAKRELKAISNMEEYFRDRFESQFTFYGKVSEVELNTISDNLQMHQAFIWPFVLASVHKHIDEVAMGYVMNDCALSYLDDIRNIFKSFSGLLYKEIPVTFPIIKLSKDTIWGELPRQLQVFVSWCESPKEDAVKCGKCSSCKRMIDNGIMREQDADGARGGEKAKDDVDDVQYMKKKMLIDPLAKEIKEQVIVADVNQLDFAF